MNIKGTQTEANLKVALAGESVARNRYSYFADAARKQGFEEEADFFETLSRNEKEHAFIWYKLLYGTPKDIQENLKMASEGEHDEWTDMYREFSDTARQEGFTEIATLFSRIARIERNHERIILKYIRQLEEKLSNGSGTMKEVVAEDNERLWICSYCGFTGETEIMPQACPLCQNSLIEL